MFSLGKESLLKGDIHYYKKVLFLGLRHFYATIEDRRVFVDQIRKTYRYSYRVLIDREISVSQKFLFLLHRNYFKMENIKLLRMTGVVFLGKVAVLGTVYWLNYVRRSSGMGSGAGPQAISGVPPAGAQRRLKIDRRRSILITRAMGGIGDLLMMTPGLHALRKKHPRERVFLAVPRRYFPLFQGNPDVSLLDIEDGTIDFLAYRKWYNFSDCPAARIESRTAPKVRKSRIDIFASAMGVGMLRARMMNHRPRYFVSDDEKAYQSEFWKQHGLLGKQVIGVQVHSDEVYRDYPHMLRLVEALGRSARVLAFDGDKRPYVVEGNVTWVSGLPLRKAFALAAGCDVIVAPDSAFVHLAAALDIPCVGLFGPIDGKVRTRHYPLCEFIDVRKQLGCMPCWRNEHIPCKLTNMRSSVCMNDIGIGEVVESVQQILRRKEQQ
jgi:ADP-heptose:LPS heptosyltransferase